jgi:hypothetical protein
LQRCINPVRKYAGQIIYTKNIFGELAAPRQQSGLFAGCAIKTDKKKGTDENE